MDPEPLELRDYLSILQARKWTILAIVVTTTAVALAYSFGQTPVYRSSAEVIVLPVSFDPTVTSTAFTPLNMLTEEQVANSATVKGQALRRLAELGIPRGRKMSARQVEGAETLVFSSVSDEPRVAQATAQAHADAYLEIRRTDLVAELESTREPYESKIDAIDAELQGIVRALQTAEGEVSALLNARYSLLLSERVSYITKLNDLVAPGNVQVGRVLQSAALPRRPVTPRPIRDGLLGLLVGLALGIGVAFLRDRLDERVRGRQELELLLGAPVLAFIPLANVMKTPRLVTVDWPRSEAAESFRSLGVKLLHVIDQRAKTIVVSSSLAKEGKTLVTANLGVTLAMAGKRVVIVSADLRRPRLQRYFRGSDFGASAGAGLTEVLAENRNPVDSLSTSGINNLRILHAGGRSDGPAAHSELLGSQSMRELVAKLRHVADVVLIDTPPLLMASDVVALAPLTDAVLFIVDPRLARRSDVEQARRELELMDVPVVGIVVNKHKPPRFRANGSGYSSYSDVREQGGGQVSTRTLRALPTDSEHRTAIFPAERDTDGLS